MKIIVDSACDLPLTYLSDKGVKMIPLSVIVDDKEYVDQFEITNEQLYAHIRAGKHPSTTQVPLEKFDRAFREAVEAGEDGIYIGLSSALSGTYQAAVLAYSQVKEEYPELDIRLIDSKNASMGIALLIREAIQLQEQGFDIDDIEDRIRFLVDHVVTLVTVQDLNYLAAGGRLSKSSAFLGGLLNIQPLLEVTDGKLEGVEKHRGRKKVLNRMIERLVQEADHIGEQSVLLVHTNEYDTIAWMKEQIEKQVRPKEILDFPVGAVIGAHTGLGTIGLFFFNELDL